MVKRQGGTCVGTPQQLLSSRLMGRAVASVTVEDDFLTLHFADDSTFVMRCDWRYSWTIAQGKGGLMV